MADDRIIVGLDIGTSVIRVAIGEVDDEGALHIVATSARPSAGLRNGVIVNIEDAKDAIKAAIEEAETKINQLINANARNALFEGTKIYLEFVVVVWVLEHINRQGRYELGEVFVKDKTIRNTVLRDSIQVGGSHPMRIS